MASSTVYFIDTPGARLAVYEEGVTGNPIVLLHGGPGVPDYLSDVSTILAGTHRVIRFDQRGTGQSTRNTGLYALQDMCRGSRIEWRLPRRLSPSLDWRMRADRSIQRPASHLVDVLNAFWAELVGTGLPVPFVKVEDR